VIGDACSVHFECSQLVAPGDGGVSIFERAHRLPSVKARVADRNGGFLGAAAQEAQTTHRYEGSLADLITTSLRTLR